MVNSYFTHELISLVEWAARNPEWRTDDTMCRIVTSVHDIAFTVKRLERVIDEKDAHIKELTEKLEHLLDHFTRPPMDLEQPPFRKWTDEENAVTDDLIEKAPPFDTSGYEAL